LPGGTEKIDVFCIKDNKEGVFLHSLGDVYNPNGGRDPVVPSRGKYRLKYLLYAESFPVVHFEINLDYQRSGTSATLEA
jgi:hypothetical protein